MILARLLTHFRQVSSQVAQTFQSLKYTEPVYVSLEETDEPILGPESEVPEIGTFTLAQRLERDVLKSVEITLKRKLDLRLLACVWVIFILNFLDRNNIAAAKIAGLQDSLHLTSAQYATSVAILFVGYVSMQIPSNIFLAQLRPSFYLPFIMASWGILSTLTGLTTNAAGLYATRFFLGVFEAAFYPGALFLLSSWYKREELGVRCAVLYSGSQIGSAFSSLIAAGLQHQLGGTWGLEAWRWIFLIEGSITIAVALSAIFILPDFPASTFWLSPTERAVAQWRLFVDVGVSDNATENWRDGFGLACVDIRVYIFAFIFIFIQTTSATANFFPSVVETLGYGKIETLLLTVPPYMAAMCVSVANNYSADRTRNSSFHIIWPLAMALVGFVVAAASLDIGTRYTAMVLMISGGHGSNAVLLAWTQKTIIRPRIKRATALAFVNAFGNLAHVFSAYLYPDSAKPRYTLAMSVNALSALAAMTLTALMRFNLIRANRRSEMKEATSDDQASSSDTHDDGVSVVKDIELGFRYDT